ncbi:hypothetical protein ACOMHN_063776 [Nucella lapillus]
MKRQTSTMLSDEFPPLQSRSAKLCASLSAVISSQEKRVHPVNAQTTPDAKHSPASQRSHHPVTRSQQTVQQPRMTSPQTNHEPPSSLDHPRLQHHCVSPSPKMTTPADNPRPRPHCAPGPPVPKWPAPLPPQLL